MNHKKSTIYELSYAFVCATVTKIYGLILNMHHFFNYKKLTHSGFVFKDHCDLIFVEMQCLPYCIFIISCIYVEYGSFNLINLYSHVFTIKAYLYLVLELHWSIFCLVNKLQIEPVWTFHTEIFFVLLINCKLNRFEHFNHFFFIIFWT
jgi:hypothetical protein